MPNKLENGAQCSFSVLFAGYLRFLSFHFTCFFHSQSFQQVSRVKETKLCCKYCNLSVSVGLNVWFTTNGMCVKNKTYISEVGPDPDYRSRLRQDSAFFFRTRIRIRSQ